MQKVGHESKNGQKYDLKIVIEAMHGLGDVVCMLPMIKEIRGAYPHAIITVLVNKKITVDIIKLSGIQIENVIAIDAHKNVINFLKICLALRKEQIDIGISSVGTKLRISKFLMAIINPTIKAGLQFTENRCYRDLKDRYHFVDAQLLILQQLGISNHHYQPKLFPLLADVERMSKQIESSKTVIGVCIGRADVSYRNVRSRRNPVYTRSWGNLDQHVSNMEELVQLILYKSYVCVLIGGKAEEEILFSLDKKVTEKCIVFVGKTSIAESMAVATLCDVVVGVDTGMQHISDAVGTKTVSIFGPTNPRTHGAYSNRGRFVESNIACKYCYGTRKYVECTARKCLTNITPAEVFANIIESLQEGQEESLRDNRKSYNVGGD